MIITPLITQHLLTVHEGNNRTGVSIADVLKDVTVQEATTIEALLHHITYWNRIVTQRINGIKVEYRKAFD